MIANSLFCLINFVIIANILCISALFPSFCSGFLVSCYVSLTKYTYNLNTRLAPNPWVYSSNSYNLIIESLFLINCNG